MPELPEAETAIKTLTPCVTGQTVASVLVGRVQAIRTPLLDDVLFATGLTGRKIDRIERRAKALLFILDDQQVMIFHFKLGALAVCHDDHVEATNGVALNFAGGSSLEFTDLQLSEFHLVPADELEELPVIKAGLDPLSRSMTVSRLKETLPPRKQLKASLTDQNTIAGIGNVYSDEILWGARLNPFRTASSLSDEEWNALAKVMKTTLRQGIKQGGEPWFRDAQGRNGRYQPKVHGRAGEPCPRDGHQIEMVKKGRKTYWCPFCQV